MTITITEHDMTHLHAGNDGTRQTTGGPRGFDVSFGTGLTIHFDSEFDAEKMADEMLWKMGHERVNRTETPK